jgi:hypothetical protein
VGHDTSGEGIGLRGPWGPSSLRKTLSAREVRAMITNRKEVEKFEKELLRNEKVDVKKNVSIINGLYDEVVALGVRVDSIFSKFCHEKQAIGRVREVPFGKTAVTFASLEDVVIHKIITN